MRKTYRPYDPDQQLLLPPPFRSGCPRTIWPTSSLTWWTSWTCRPSWPAIRAKERGGPPYHPWMMVKVLL